MVDRFPYERNPLQMKDFSSLLASLAAARDEAYDKLQAVIDDPTFSVQSQALKRALLLNRRDVVEEYDGVNSFVSEVVRLKRADPTLTDQAIHEAVNIEANDSPDDPLAQQRLRVSNLLLDPAYTEVPTYIFEVPQAK